MKKALYRCALLAVAYTWLFATPGSAADEPRGLLLRKGLVTWQMQFADARRMVEENIRPNTLVLLRNQKPEGFACEPGAAPGVSRCVWACCVDLGEQGTVHFATLWFLRDQFYAYDVVFDTGLFPRLSAALTDRVGGPSKETQETRVAPALSMGQFSTYAVNAKRWDSGDSVILLEDRGGQGKPLAGHIYVAYLPLARKALPQKTEDTTPLRLPF